MKKILLSIGLATGLAANLFAGETLNLKLVPDRDVLLTGTPQEVVVKIDLAAIADRKKIRRTPLNLAVVIDRSGSMTGAKLEKTKQAAMQLVDRLTRDDIFSLIVFSDEAEVLVPAHAVDDKAALREKIQAITAAGSTALYSGVKLGADQIEEYLSSRRINRVLLLSDGLANVGPSTPHDLRRLGRTLSEHGVSVTTIGVGDDYNEDLMAGLAESSDANYYYVKDTEKLPEIFARELGELLAVAARDIRIEIICPEGVKPLGFIGRTEQFESQQATVKLSQFTLGQNRSLFLRCLVTQARTEVARVRVSYKDELDNSSDQSASGVVKVQFTADRKSADQSFNYAVNAEKELVLTAVAKDAAMAQADQGKLEEAAGTLKRQKAHLDAVYASAPASVQGQIRAETNYLSDFSDQLSGGAYGAGTRKVMQSQSYNSRNSK